MGKFINVPLPLVNAAANIPGPITLGNSGTTTAAAVGKLTDGGGAPNFVGNVSVGDIVVPTGSAATVYSEVTAVDSDSVLSISGSGNTLLEATPQAYTIQTQADAYSVGVHGVMLNQAITR